MITSKIYLLINKMGILILKILFENKIEFTISQSTKSPFWEFKGLLNDLTLSFA
jgi:hypothetical protein